MHRLRFCSKPRANASVSPAPDFVASREGDRRERGRVPIARTISAREFDRLLASFSPFEPNPRIAVGLSGGPDSLALCLLLHSWVERHGGALIALTVDHRLRRASRQEARLVKDQLRKIGVRHVTLVWRDGYAGGNLQARARTARYELLTDWCRRHGVLHLALAHHQGDQAETVLMRLGRGSGHYGLCGMPVSAEHADLRIIRPLLSCPRARLEATVRKRGLTWLEDPSNRNPVFARSRIRRLLPELGREGITPERLAATAVQLARARGAIEPQVDRLLARFAVLHPGGFAWLDREFFAARCEETLLRALAQLLTSLGGQDYPPRFKRLEGLRGRLSSPSFRGATLAGCQLLPRKGRILIVREAAKAKTVPIAGRRTLWDGRFEVVLTANGVLKAAELEIGPLGAAAAKLARRHHEDLTCLAIPAPALRSLPGIRCGGGPPAAPHLGFLPDSGLEELVGRCRFAPKNPLTSAGFTVA